MKLEFYVSPEGEVRVVDKERGEDFSLMSRKNLVASIALQICTQFHDSWDACVKEAKRMMPKGTSSEWEGYAVQRFLRCNFGERDVIPDWNEGQWELEEVKCHLRGICPFNNIICHPHPSKLTENEAKGVAHLCLGCETKRLEDKIFKAGRTVRSMLMAIREKLHCDTNEGIVRKCRGLHMERRFGILY